MFSVLLLNNTYHLLGGYLYRNFGTVFSFGTSQAISERIKIVLSFVYCRYPQKTINLSRFPSPTVGGSKFEIKKK